MLKISCPLYLPNTHDNDFHDFHSPGDPVPPCVNDKCNGSLGFHTKSLHARPHGRDAEWKSCEFLAFFRVMKNHLEFLIFAFGSIPDFVLRCQKTLQAVPWGTRRNKKSACFCIKSRLLVLKSIKYWNILKPSIKSTLWTTQRPIKPNMICGSCLYSQSQTCWQTKPLPTSWMLGKHHQQPFKAYEKKLTFHYSGWLIGILFMACHISLSKFSIYRSRV